MFEEFQESHHCGHLGYRNERILAILNLCVAPMPPIKFRLNPTYVRGEMPAEKKKNILDIGTERFYLAILNLHGGHFGYRNGRILAILNASHQVSAQCDLWFGRRCRLKNFILDTETLCQCDSYHQVLAQSDL